MDHNNFFGIQLAKAGPAGYELPGPVERTLWKIVFVALCLYLGYQAFSTWQAGTVTGAIAFGLITLVAFSFTAIYIFTDCGGKVPIQRVK